MRFFYRCFLICICFSFTPQQEQNCSDALVLKNNDFTYMLAERQVLVVFENNEHIEYHQNKKYVVKSTIDWVSSCEYYLTINETNLPDFPFEIGTKLRVQITKVKGNKVYYKTSLNDRVWEGRMEKKTNKP